MYQWCPDCNKWAYTSYAEALHVKTNIRKRLHRTPRNGKGIYECPSTRRTWHLTGR